MKLVRPKFEVWKQDDNLDSLYKHIEKCGRVCYRSEDKVTEDSAKPFIDRLIKSGHTSVLEHGTVYLYVNDYKKEYLYTRDKYIQNPYSRVTDITYSDGRPMDSFISTNMRVLVENNWLDDLKYLCEPTKYHEKRITVKFILSRSIAQEYTRHRVFSYSMESQRYCNYSTDKFSNEVTFIQPCWLNEERLKLYGPYHTVIRDKSPESIFIASLNCAERDYLDLLKAGWKPQQAREVLPNACKTELVMTGFVSQWKDFFFLRCPVNAHPQARELAVPLKEEFIKRGYYNEETSIH